MDKKAAVRNGIVLDFDLPKPPVVEYKFKCEFENCDKKFVKLSRLKFHQNVHSNEKPYKCSFEGCNSAYFRPSHLQRHESCRHSSNSKDEEGAFKCSFDGCVASFDLAKSLYYHEKRKHQPKREIGKYQCSLCEKKFSKKFLCKEHEAVHTGEKAFECSIKGCEERFDTRASFKSHLKAHKGDLASESPSAYTCTECDAQFSKWSLLLAHKKEHPMPLKVSCPVCSKMFSKSSFKVHQKVHEEDRTAFTCPHDGCPRFYFHVKNLTHHVRITHEGVGFQCDICMKKLSTKQKLNQHIKRIHEEASLQDTLKLCTLKPKFNREKVLKMLCGGEKQLNVKRRGPAKGSKQKSRSQNLEIVQSLLSDGESGGSRNTSGENSPMTSEYSCEHLEGI